jgi:hypothetical protein
MTIGRALGVVHFGKNRFATMPQDERKPSALIPDTPESRTIPAVIGPFEILVPLLVLGVLAILAWLIVRRK